MNVNGIWKAEIFGPYGWEPMATAFLEDGKFRVGGRNHYEIGSYEISGSRIKVWMKYITHGEARTMFGKRIKEMDLEIEGDIEGNRIPGYISEKDNNYEVVFRATRLADLLP